MQYVRLSIVVTTLIVAFSLAGCSSSTTPSNTTQAQLQWKQGETATFQKMPIDTATGQPVPSSAITQTTTLEASNVTEWGMTNSQVELDTYSDGTLPDTLYYNQNSSGDLSAYNFASIGALASIQALASNIGIALPSIGWVLQIKMSASANTTWTAFNDSVTQNLSYSGLTVPVTARLSDQAIMMADTTYNVGSKSYTIKHARHVITLAATGTVPFVGTETVASWSETIDTYVSADLATTVMNVTTPSVITFNSLLSQGPRSFEGVLLQLSAHS